MNTQTEKATPFYAEIRQNLTGHPFAKGNIVDVVDFFIQFRGTKFYHAVFSDKKKWIVSENEIQTIVFD